MRPIRRPSWDRAFLKLFAQPGAFFPKALQQIGPRLLMALQQICMNAWSSQLHGCLESSSAWLLDKARVSLYDQSHSLSIRFSPLELHGVTCSSLLSDRNLIENFGNCLRVVGNCLGVVLGIVGNCLGSVWELFGNCFGIVGNCL